MCPRYQRASDLLELRDLLQATLVGLTMDEVGDHFEVSRRTAERMVAAIRDRFPGLHADFRDGKKYWNLRFSASTQPLELPSNLAQLSHRLRTPTPHVSTDREAGPTDHTITDDILGHSAVGIFVLDDAFRVVWLNASLERYFGIDRHEVIGRDKRQLIREKIRTRLEDPHYFQERVFATYRDNTYIEHFQCHILPGVGREERWLEHWSQPIEGGPYAGGRVEHYVDVTDRVREQILRRFELHDLKSELRASRSGGVHQEMASAVAHSIRTPLSEILAIVRRAESREGREGDPEALDSIEKLARWIGDTVDQMLKLTNRESLNFEATNPRVLLERVAREIELITQRADIEVSVEVAPEFDAIAFSADPKLLRCALHELLENAVHAMPDGGRLSLAVAHPGGDPARIRFRVVDEGPGVAEDLQKLIFEAFYTTRPEGSGLGLAIARRIVEEHHGAIGLEEDRESGACFYIEIPVFQESV